MVNIPLSDEDWSRVAHLFSSDDTRRFGRPRRPAREVLNAVLWVLVNQERWHRLPPRWPPSQTCYIKWLQWKRSGLMDEVFEHLGLHL